MQIGTRHRIVAAYALASTAAAPLYGQAAQWTLNADLRIDASSRPTEALTRIGDIAIDRNGTVYVSQPDDYLIRVYASSGEAIRVIGRQGSGPGEFRRIDKLQASSRGLLVLDRVLSRLTLFSLAGRATRQWSAFNHQYSEGLASRAPVGQLANGSLVAVPAYLQVPEDGVVTLPVLLFDTAGNFQRQIAALTAGDLGKRVEAGGIVAVIPQPVSSQSLYTIAPDGSGIVIAHRSIATAGRPGDVHVLKIAASGDTMFSKRFRIPGVAVSREIVERERERLIANAMRGRPFSREQVAALYRIGWTAPDYQAPIDHLFAANDGTIWMRRGSFGLGEATWWILNEGGILVGQTTVPATVQLHGADGPHVWAATTDDVDEPAVIRYRVTKTPVGKSPQNHR